LTPRPAEGPRALFVVGAPRSGTTILGRYIGTHPEILDFGEYPGFDLAGHVTGRMYDRMPSPYTAAYSAEIEARSYAFPCELAAGYGWHLHSAPWNVFHVESLLRYYPEARFVLCCREAPGVCLSLARSWRDGRSWAGRNTYSRLTLWSHFYEAADSLPPKRTITVSYEAFCADPEKQVAALDRRLAGLGLPEEGYDRSVFAESHATDGRSRPTFARMGPDGQLTWTGRAAFDAAAWTWRHRLVHRVHPASRLIAERLADRLAQG
jgi:hypothetical protein